MALIMKRQKEYVEITLRNAIETLCVIGNNTGAIWVAPVQGAEHSDLVEHSARELTIWVFS